MNCREDLLGLIREVERVMLAKFQTEPFHNLYLKCGYMQQSLEHGGTCSDKTLSFYESVKALPVMAHLHSARIRGKDIHRLLRVRISGQDFFADVGSGWPTTRLHPVDQEISYESFGIGFRTVLLQDCLAVYCSRDGGERHMMDVPLASDPESEIIRAIQQRFHSGIEYPFSAGIRFSKVVGDRFLFLRDDQLEIYSPNEPCRVLEGLAEDQLAHTLKVYFDFDLGVLRPDST
jgi:arylamine N-acetyltransferase